MEQKKLRSELPHLHGKKFYAWARKFYDSDNRVNLLCAANQISKSSTAIRRCIANATDKSRWKKLWGAGKRPTQFWYFYPDSNTLMREWQTKWMEWMPSGAALNSPDYGWRVVMERGAPKFIEFQSGVIVFFQFYTKSIANVQSSTVHEIYVDEELPMEFYDELMFRLTTTNGIFNAVFTPTLNQSFWKRAMETDDVLATANKQVVSMFDCLAYEDGTPGHFTNEQIKAIIGRCKNNTEIQRRVFGKFITEQGRVFYAYEETMYVKPKEKINYSVYSAVDYGSGGSKGHPAAIVFIAVSPDYRSGYVIKCWRGDGIETTAGDVFHKHMELCREITLPIVLSTYDPSSRDFAVIAERNGKTFIKADKTREAGEEIVNTLFRNKMLFIEEHSHEEEKLNTELLHYMKDNRSITNKSGDDLCDALRYCCMLIPWDFTGVDGRRTNPEQEAPMRVLTEQELLEEQIQERRGIYKKGSESEEWQEITDEMEYWNEQYG